MLGAGGAVAAGGLLDRHPAELVEGAACGISAGDGRVVATAVDERGATLELWVLDSAEGFGNLVVETAPDGTWVGSTMGCGPIARSDDSYYGSGEAWAEAAALSDDDVTLVSIFGWIPAPATEAVVTLTDGTTVTVNADTDGYFLHPIAAEPNARIDIAGIAVFEES